MIMVEGSVTEEWTGIARQQKRLFRISSRMHSYTCTTAQWSQWSQSHTVFGICCSCVCCACELRVPCMLGSQPPNTSYPPPWSALCIRLQCATVRLLAMGVCLWVWRTRTGSPGTAGAVASAVWLLTVKRLFSGVCLRTLRGSRFILL